MAEFSDFEKLDIRVGRVDRVKDFPEARNPAYRLWIDFGEELGTMKSSAQITELYNKKDLEDRQVIAVVNFSPLNIAGFESEVLVLGVYSGEGVVLLQPEQEVEVGGKIG
ncbi:MAG: tRNA-binding protein [Bacillota bacterium]